MNAQSPHYASTTYDFDYFVIGGGSGGVRSARVAAELGARVGIAEESCWGGTCVNLGCVPKKILAMAARYPAKLANAPALGWRVPSMAHDWATLVASKDREVARLNGAYGSLLSKAGCTCFEARATLLDANTVAIGDRKVTAERILVATGGRPILPPSVTKSARLFTSDEAFHLPDLPRRVLVVGGGLHRGGVRVTIAALFTVAVAWSIVGKVDMIASAPGSVIPVGKSKVVQPLEAGIVTAILVKDGDHVTAGQRLIELDAVQTGAERDRLARDLRQARLDAAGLAALRHDIATGAGLGSFAAPAGTPAAEAEVERLTIAARQEASVQKTASLFQQIAAKQAELAENTAGMERLRISLPFLQKKRDMYRALLRSGLTQVPAWADAEQAASDQQQQILVMGQHAADIGASRASLVRDLAQTRAEYAHGVMKDASDADQKVGELTAQLAAASRRTEEAVLAAPIAGTVQDLAAHTVGGVVTPAQPLLTLVPDGGPVMVEATVENRDVGFVHPGQDVQVKVETFTFTRYGLTHGHIVDVSRDAASGPQAKPTGVKRDDADDQSQSPKSAGYVAHVSLDRDTLVVDGQEQRLQPGMQVTAEIKTGRRSVIDYLLSPLSRYVHEGMTER